MSTTVARWVLVGTAVVLVLTGTLVALPGAGRAALLGAGACCAALDIAVARAGRSAPSSTVAVLPPEPDRRAPSADPEPTAQATPETVDAAEARGAGQTAVGTAEPRDTPPATGTSGASGIARAAGVADARGAAQTAAGTAVAPSLMEAPDAAEALDGVETGTPGAALDLGRGPDGEPVRVALDGTAPTHVAVVGTGPLAWAVHRAVAAQLRDLAGVVELRSAVAVDLADADRAEDTNTPAVPPPRAGTAVSVALGSDAAVRASVVLVPDDGQRPRHVDVVVHVSRYGCSLTPAGERHGVALDPVLPLLSER